MDRLIDENKVKTTLSETSKDDDYIFFYVFSSKVGITTKHSLFRRMNFSQNTCKSNEKQ